MRDGESLDAESAAEASSNDDSHSVTNVFERLRQGEAGAVEVLWERFMPRLAGLARKTIAGRKLRMAGEEDAMQSVFLSFWQRANEGQFSGVWNRNDIWSLLAKMTVRKSLNLSRRERAKRRGGGRVLNESALAGRDGGGAFGEGGSLDEAMATMPTHDFDLHTEELLMQLDDELRMFAVLRLMEYKNREIAEMLECTERRVERKLERIRSLWEHEVAE